MTISNNFEYEYEESSFLEIFQLILLISSLLIQFFKKKFFEQIYIVAILVTWSFIYFFNL